MFGWIFSSNFESFDNHNLPIMYPTGACGVLRKGVRLFSCV